MLKNIWKKLYSEKSKSFLNKSQNKNSNEDHMKYLSMGLLILGSGGLFFTAKYDINKRGILSHLVENFTTSINENPSKDELQAFENKVVYSTGIPLIRKFAKDDFFDIEVENCIYLTRNSEMYQQHYKTQTVTDSKGKEFKTEVIDYKWSGHRLHGAYNPPFPEYLKSKDYVSSDIFLNGFWIPSSSIYREFKNLAYRLNPMQYETEQVKQKRIKPYQMDNKYKWKLNNYEYYGREHGDDSIFLNKVGDFRVKFYCYCLDPKKGLSVIGQVKQGKIEPISISEKNSWSLFFVKDHYETPMVMIKSTVEKIKTRFHFMFATSVAAICLGIYLSNISRYFYKINSNLNDNQTKLQNLVQGSLSGSKIFSNINKISPVYKSIIYSLLLGVTSSFIVFNFIQFTEREHIKNEDKISNIYSYKELLSAEFTTEDENVAGRKKIDNIIE